MELLTGWTLSVGGRLILKGKEQRQKWRGLQIQARFVCDPLKKWIRGEGTRKKAGISGWDWILHRRWCQRQDRHQGQRHHDWTNGPWQIRGNVKTRNLKQGGVGVLVLTFIMTLRFYLICRIYRELISLSRPWHFEKMIQDHKRVRQTVPFRRPIVVTHHN